MLKIRSLALLTLMLAGCGAQSIKPDYVLQEDSKEGIVFFSVSHDLAGGRRAKAIFYLNGGITGTNGSAVYSLDDTVPSIPGKSEFKDSYGHLLTLSLPAGRHEITGWQISNGSGLRIFPKVKPAPLVFEVSAGEAKYLGNLHANLERGKNFFGMTITSDGLPEVRDMSARDIPLFAQKYPQLQDKTVVQMLPLGLWISSIETQKQVDIPPTTAIPPVKK